MPNAQGRTKFFSRLVADDESVLARVRFVGDDNAAGAAATAATVAVNAADVRVAINGTQEGLNDYTGASGAAGIITFADGNVDTIAEFVNALNGIATGQAANRRWRAAQGDFPNDYTLDATTGLVTAAANTLLGHRDAGLSLFSDRSAATLIALWVGVGTERGVLPGGGLVFPDYFEDIPGTAGITGFASNTPDRTRRIAKQNDESVIVSTYTPVITNITANVDYANNDTVIDIWDNSLDPDADTALFLETLGDSSIANGEPRSALLRGTPGGFEFRGTPGQPLFVRVRGTGAFVDEGGVVVSGYYELSLNRAA